MHDKTAAMLKIAYEAGVKLAIKLRGLHGTNAPFKTLRPWGGKAGPLAGVAREPNPVGVYAMIGGSPGLERAAKSYADRAVLHRGGEHYLANLPIDTQTWWPLTFRGEYGKRTLREFLEQQGIRRLDPRRARELLEYRQDEIKMLADEADTLIAKLRSAPTSAERDTLRKQIMDRVRTIREGTGEWYNPEEVTPLSWKRLAPGDRPQYRGGKGLNKPWNRATAVHGEGTKI